MSDSMDDLQKAFSSFTTGVKDLAFQRALDQANQQVQQVKSTESDEAKQRVALQGISNNLVMQMAQYGVPATTMQAVQGAVGPRQYSNASDMYRQGLLTGDTQLQQMGQQSQQFDAAGENAKLQNEMKIAQLHYGEMAGYRKLAEDDKLTNQFNSWGKQMDISAANSRSMFGQTAQNLQYADRLQALMDNNFSGATIQDANLIASGLNRLAKGGVATDAEMKSLLPHSAEVTGANMYQFLTNKPATADLQAFMQKYQDIIDRERNANLDSAQNTILNKASEGPALRLAKRDPDTYKQTVAHSLNQAGMTDVKPEDVVITPSGATTKQFQAADAAEQAAGDSIKHVYQFLNSGDADKVAQAKQWLAARGLDASAPAASVVRFYKKSVRRNALMGGSQ